MGGGEAVAAAGRVLEGYSGAALFLHTTACCGFKGELFVYPNACGTYVYDAAICRGHVVSFSWGTVFLCGKHYGGTRTTDPQPR